MTTTELNQSPNATVLVLIALLQGFALLLLHQAIELQYWLHDQPPWLFALYGLALPIPVLLMLSLNTGNAWLVTRWIVPVTLVYFGTGWYVGSQALPVEQVGYSSLLVPYALTLLVATFKVLIYLQQFAERQPLTYSRLYRLSWRNFLTVGLALLFALCLWGVLLLWAKLFEAIGINYFGELFAERWFYYPVLALANGFGIVLLRQLSGVIDTIARIQQTLMKFLLVLLILLAVLFLSALSVTGLEPLWASGGSNLILWMLALLLFFLNAVYQDDPEVRPYPLWLHRLIYLGVALLPVYCLISLYGLSLRIDQYGWTVSRSWASLILAVFTLFAAGYLVGIVRFRDAWLRQLSRVNVAMGLVVLALMVLVNTPLLDFRKTALSSQLDRLDSREVTPEEFDYHYLRRYLAGPGYQALQVLRERFADTHPTVAVRIDNMYRRSFDTPEALDKTLLLAAIETDGRQIPEDLGDALHQHLRERGLMLSRTMRYRLAEVDLDADGVRDYLLAQQQPGSFQITLFYLDEDTWQTRNVRIDSQPEPTAPEQLHELFDALVAGEFETTAPRWRQLRVDGRTLRVW